MRNTDFNRIIPILKNKAASMFSHVVAVCPDDHINHDLLEVRTLARKKGFEFNRIITDVDYPSQPKYYGFFLNDEPVAVIERFDDHFEIYSDYKGEA